MEDKVEEQIKYVKKSITDTIWRIARDIGWSALSQVGELVTFVQHSASSFADGNSPQSRGMDYEDGLRMKKEHSSESLLSRKPSHSVLDSLSSFSSVESISDVIEREAYIADFVSMLKEGLYVFASAADSAEEESSKRFRLRVFFYECDDEDSDPYFVLHPVENNAENSHDDIEIISIADVGEIRQSGTNGIEFIAATESSSSLGNVNMAHSESEPSLIQTVSMKSVSSTPSIPEEEEVNGKGVVRSERVLAEIILSNVEDRETLFQGLNVCFSEFCQRSSPLKDSSEDIEESEEDDDDDEHMDNAQLKDSSEDIEESQEDDEDDEQMDDAFGEGTFGSSDAEFVDWNSDPNTKGSDSNETEDQLFSQESNEGASQIGEEIINKLDRGDRMAVDVADKEEQ